MKTEIKKLVDSFAEISDERKSILYGLSEIIKNEIRENSEAKLTFICTHNSRRSHMAQVWAELAAEHYGIEGILTYSGGTEATAVYPSAVETFKEFGLNVELEVSGDNPHYSLSVADKNIVLFSKEYSHDSNPQSGYTAIMVCSHADANCPIVFGAKNRVSLPYADPKDFDGTPDEKEKYMERFLEIGREILYTLSKIS
jgi:arsenate reductase